LFLFKNTVYFICQCVSPIYVLVKLSETHPDAKALIAEAKQDDAEYAAFIRELTKSP
jgi:hypothetical protein